jgi:hypothetical protein
LLCFTVAVFVFYCCESRGVHCWLEERDSKLGLLEDSSLEFPTILNPSLESATIVMDLRNRKNLHQKYWNVPKTTEDRLVSLNSSLEACKLTQKCH